MGRKHTYTQSELLQMTEKLLIDYGYDGFHLKLLSEHLHGARSTIYQYYANKDEIVADCAKYVIMRVYQKVNKIDETNEKEGLKKLFSIFTIEVNLYHFICHARKVNRHISNVIDLHVDEMEFYFKEITNILIQWLIKCQLKGIISKELEIPVLMSVFFAFVDTPNLLKRKQTDWVDTLFSLWLKSVK